LFSGSEEEDGDINFLSSYEDTPPVVAEWVEKGCTVYELTNWQNEDPDGKSDDRETLYAVIDSGELAKAYIKSEKTFIMDFEDPNRERPSWGELSVDKQAGEGSSVSWKLSYDAEKESIEWVVTLDNGRVYQRELSRIYLHLDHELGEGYWDGRYTMDQKFSGRMAHLPDQHKEAKLGSYGKAGTVIIHRP